MEALRVAFSNSIFPSSGGYKGAAMTFETIEDAFHFVSSAPYGEYGTLRVASSNSTFEIVTCRNPTIAKFFHYLHRRWWSNILEKLSAMTASYLIWRRQLEQAQKLSAMFGKWLMGQAAFLIDRRRF
jgi:hypothetical protein